MASAVAGRPGELAEAGAEGDEMRRLPRADARSQRACQLAMAAKLIVLAIDVALAIVSSSLIVHT
jgi:hypothetical protein